MGYKDLKAKAVQFLENKKIVVVGVSSTNPQEAANGNFKALKEMGYEVLPVNPKMSEYEGERCYHNIDELDQDVGAALIFTHPAVTANVAKSCYDKGIRNIWIHRSFGDGSHSDEAADFFKDKENVNFIDGACPMMFIKRADWFHKSLKTIMKWTGKLPN